VIEYEAEISIDAPPEDVWAVLTAIDDYPEWDPYCERIEGELVLGQKIKAYSTLAPGRAFPVKVTTLDENSEMVWSGGMPLGLFKGVRTFTLEPRDGGTDFRIHEAFSGPMLFMIKKSLPDMTEPFQAFAKGLKERAEARTS